jgi:hypothetical protein
MREPMIRPALLLTLAMVSLGCAMKEIEYADYGESQKMTEAETVPIADVMKSSEVYKGKFIRASGEIVSVCAMKGCWLRMAPNGDSEESVFVKFTCPVEGRLIPVEAVGHEVVVEGTVEVEMMTEDEARHYAEDAGKSEEEIARIVGDQKVVRISSPAARVVGITSESGS